MLRTGADDYRSCSFRSRAAGGTRQRKRPDRYADPAFDALADAIGDRRGPRGHPYWSDAEPCSMLIDEVEAIWASIADRDDWGPFDAKIAAIRRMGEALAEG